MQNSYAEQPYEAETLNADVFTERQWQCEAIGDGARAQQSPAQHGLLLNRN
ncbi:hypothetical protein M758_5G091600 [Ceratodon purpureus]|nr:hypothetical protein M758_5G091600 [Ceratodon purpureus]